MNIGESPRSKLLRQHGLQPHNPLVRLAVIASGLCLLALASLVGVYNVMSDETNTTTIMRKESQAMRPATQLSSAPRAGIPPIDAAIPAETQTATFALG